MRMLALKEASKKANNLAESQNQASVQENQASERTKVQKLQRRTKKYTQSKEDPEF